MKGYIGEAGQLVDFFILWENANLLDLYYHVVLYNMVKVCTFSLKILSRNKPHNTFTVPCQAQKFL